MAMNTQTVTLSQAEYRHMQEKIESSEEHVVYLQSQLSRLNSIILKEAELIRLSCCNQVAACGGCQ